MRNLKTLFSAARLLLYTLLFLLSTQCVFAQKVKPGVSIGHALKVVAFDFSPNEKFIVSAGEDGVVKLWETKTGRLVKDWDPAPDRSGSFKYTSDVAFLDDQYILVATNGKPLQRWEFASTGENSVEAFLDSKLTEQPTVRAFRVHHDSKEMLVLDFNNNLKIWSTKSTNKPGTEMEATSERITSFCFSQDGKMVHAGTVEGNVVTWDAKKGKRLKSEKMYNSPVLSLEADAAQGSNLVLSGTEKTLEVWDVISPNSKTSLPGAYSPANMLFPIRTTQFSTDGKYIAYGANSMAVVWDAAGKAVKQQFFDPKKEERDGRVYAVCFSADNQKLLVGYDNGTILMWEVETGKLIHRMEGRPLEIKQLAFANNHQSAFVIHDSNKDITYWNGKNAVEKTLKGHRTDVLTAAFSPKGNFLLSCSDDGNLIKWNYLKDSILWQSGPRSEAIVDMAISPDEKTVIALTDSKSVEVWDLERMKVDRTLSHNQGKVTSIGLSADGKYAMTASSDNSMDVYEVENGFEKTTIKGQKPRINPVGFSPDGKYAVSVSCNYGLIEVWNLKIGQLSYSYKTKDFEVLSGHPFVCGPSGRPAFSSDNRHFMVPSLHGAMLWDLETGQPLILQGNTKDVRSVAFASPEIAVVGGNDGSMTLFKVADGKPLVTIYQLNGNNSVVIAPDGLFDATPGALDQMYFVKDLETIDLAQLKDLYYEPNLLSILMGYKNERLRNVGVLEDLKLYPEVSAEIKNDKLYIDLTERGGGIGKVSVFINGTEVIEDACDGAKNCSPIDLEQFTKHFFYNEEEQLKNVITIYAYNMEGWLKSPPNEVYPFRATSKGGPGGGLSGLGKKMAPRPDPGIYAIVIGTSNYKDDNIDLNFPDEDAKAIATSIQTISAPFFKGPKLVKQLTTDATNQSDWPSKANIEAAFKEVAAKANAEDVFFLFLSGHGVTYSEGNDADFYYLTMDCGDMNLANADIRKNFCISTDTLTSWITLIPAKKRVVVLDACHSGKAAENLFAGKSLSASQERELERLKDRTGMFVLASSESGQKSWEDKNLQQGLLTYSLLFGMAKTAGSSGVDVSELFNFARDHVPTLAEGINESQKPVLTVPSKEASSFAIGVVTDPKEIPIRKKNDFVAPSLFLDKNKMDDHLFLSNLFDEHLAEDKVNGKLGKMVLATSPRIKDVYAIRGMYEVQNGTGILNGKLFRGGVEKADFKVEFKTDDSPAVLVKKIEDAVNGVL